MARRKSKSQIEEAFREFERDLRVAADIDADDIEDALHDAADLVTDEMRARVPVETGQLSESITFETADKSRDGVRVIVGFDRDGWYAHFVELGTKHVPADPFMRPAFDESVDELFAVVADRLRHETGGD